ncbi:MAG: peptidylprolyl isomerase [Lysobacter sp.]|nr:peptidylprolyl isomerase [Lysobacter sp.]
MLQALRDKSSGWIATVVLGLLIVPFAFFGMEQYLFQRNDTFAAKIEAPPAWWRSAPDWWIVRKIFWSAEEIAADDFRRSFEQARQQQRQAQGEAFDSRRFETMEKKREVLDSLIDQTVMRIATENAGFAIGDEQVKDYIASIPMFQVDGKFNVQRYRLALSSMNPARTSKQFEEEIRQSLQQSLIAARLSGSAFLTKSETLRLIALLRETRDVSFLTLSAPAADNTPVPAAEIAAWYKAHQNDFRSPEQVTLEYVEIDGSALPMPDISDEEELRTRFEQEKARFVEPEQRMTSHILVAVDAGADAAKQKAAETRAQSLLQQAKGGADFATLARQNSDDAGSKTTGGDLGWIAQNGQMVKPFEDAVFATPAGTISGPVKTDFGYHIVQVREIKSGKAMSFEEALPELERLVLESGRERAFNDLTNKVVDEVLKSPTSLAPAAKAANLTVQRIGPFARGRGTGIASNPAVMRAAFSESAKQDRMVSDPIEIDGSRSVLIRVVEHQPEAVQPLTKVGPQVVAAVREDRAKKAAKAQADAVLARLNKGETLLAVSENLKLPMANVPSVPRGAPMPTAEAVEAYFEAQAPKADKPSYGTVEVGPAQYVVFAVTKISSGDAAEVTDEERKGFVQQLAPRLGDVDTKAIVDAARKKMKIDIAEDRL